MNKEDLKGISLLIIHLAHIVYRNIQSHVKKKKNDRLMHISLDQKLNTDDIIKQFKLHFTDVHKSKMIE